MRSVFNRVIIALLLVTMTGVAAFAKTKKTTVVFDTDTTVSGTIVKRGTYELVYNEETNELSIVKGRKVIAKTNAQLAMRDSKAKTTEIHTLKDGDKASFIGVAFKGSEQNIVAGDSGMQAGGND